MLYAAIYKSEKRTPGAAGRGDLSAFNILRKSLTSDIDDLHTIHFHRSEIIGCKGSFLPLRDPILRTRFNQELLQILSNTDYTILLVSLDKVSHKEHYRAPTNPYHHAMIAILERYISYLEKVGGR